MKLYRHYKNKPYTYVGIAKHSETLEDVVVYECRYPNDRAKLWVRPRKMFEENVNDKPRFEKIEAQFEILTTIPNHELDALCELNRLLFTDWDEDHFRQGFADRPDKMLLKATVDGKLAGYKLGCRSIQEGSTFYSWLGGVHPEFRGLGLAEDLMAKQHEWAKEQGYKKVSTKTLNRFKPMLTLNLKAGFDIVGAEADPKDGRFKIHLEKNL